MTMFLPGNLPSILCTASRRSALVVTLQTPSEEFPLAGLMISGYCKGLGRAFICAFRWARPVVEIIGSSGEVTSRVFLLSVHMSIESDGYVPKPSISAALAVAVR